MAWRYALVFMAAVLGPQAARSEDAPPSRKTIAFFVCLDKFAAALDDRTSDPAVIGAAVALRCANEFEAMAQEGADEETHHVMARQGFLEAAREHQTEFATNVVLEARKSKH